MKPSRAILAPQELEIMKVVWAHRAATVRDVYEDLRARRRVAYTTVMTMMNVLERKGHLKKQAEGRSFVYQPARPKRQVVRAMVREFLDRLFGGSAEPLLVQLVQDRRLTERDLADLARRIRKAR
jgi:BlaI family transcriptional regulator, penicillinase repressor